MGIGEERLSDTCSHQLRAEVEGRHLHAAVVGQCVDHHQQSRVPRLWYGYLPRPEKVATPAQVRHLLQLAGKRIGLGQLDWQKAVERGGFGRTAVGLGYVRRNIHQIVAAPVDPAGVAVPGQRTPLAQRHNL